MTQEISMDKKYRTRSGLPVRVLCVDREHPTHPVVTLITVESGVEFAVSLTMCGKYYYTYNECELDLIEVSPLTRTSRLMIR